MNSSANCPHCNSPCSTEAVYCTNCGKAVSAGMAGPRIVSGAGIANTETGRSLQAEALVKNMKKSFGALLAVGILQAVFGTVILTTLNSQNAELGVSISILAVYVYGIAAIFLALAMWARRSPFPASIIGLVVFLTVHLLEAIADPKTIVNGIIVKIIVILILSKAISAGAQHRAILKAQATGA